MRIFTTLCLMLLSLASFSQAKMVFDGSIGLAFNGGGEVNPIYLVIDNPNADAIVDFGTPGGPAILSEDEFHIVKWNLGTSGSGIYTIPFISPTGGFLPAPDYVAASVNVANAGAGPGSLEFSTYFHDDVLANAPTDVIHMNQHPSGLPGGEAYAMDRFWIIDATGYTTKPSVNLSFSYDPDEIDASMVESEMLVQRYNPIMNRWLDLNLSGQVLINEPANAISVIPNIADVDFFRSWTISSASNPLPIELLSFKSECKGNLGVELQWSTASEIDNSHFTLERSEDGIIWETFADQILGAGNSSAEQEYTQMDNNPFRGLTYYRLTQTDFDGEKETFDPIVSDCDGVGFEIITAYEMQTADKLQLVVSAAHDEVFEIELMDMSGKRAVYEQKVALQEGLNYFTIDKNNLGFGMYIIKLQSETELLTRKILLN